MPSLTAARSRYDEVLYPSGVFSQTHPNRLATQGYLRGLQPCPPECCRVLELGCGSGTNLIAMAFQIPDSQFVGVDSAAIPIAAGRKLAAELGLSNLQLHHCDLANATKEEFGLFDYIVTHGVYSWVPRSARDHILRVSRDLLLPEGIAYVSYNAYPGNHFRDLVRAMIRFHVAGFSAPADQIGQARGLLKFLGESKIEPDYYTLAIEAEFRRTLKYTDEAFFHDDLSTVNQPFYFHEFMTEAARFGMRYVGEADVNELHPTTFTPAALTRLQELDVASEIVQEQFKDFLRACSFRQTLLCHEAKRLSRDLLLERVPDLHAICNAVPAEATSDGERSEAVFKHVDGTEIGTADPGVAAALRILCEEYPRPVHFPVLLSAALDRHAGTSPASELEADLAAVLLRGHKIGFCRLFKSAYKVANRLTERPTVSKLARLLVSRGASAVSQLHATVSFPDPVSRRLITVLDGTRSVEEITRELILFVQSGQGAVYENGAPVLDERDFIPILHRRVREGLRSLLRNGMLIE